MAWMRRASLIFSPRLPDRQTFVPRIRRAWFVFSSKARSVATAGEPTGPGMPSFAWKLSDDQAAAVLSYIRNSWSASAPAVDAVASRSGPHPRLEGGHGALEDPASCCSIVLDGHRRVREALKNRYLGAKQKKSVNLPLVASLSLFSTRTTRNNRPPCAALVCVPQQRR
jgi:hypothetical protein